MDFEMNEYIDVKTFGLMKDTKDYKPKNVVNNDLKHTYSLTEIELNMPTNQCLVTREGEKRLRHTSKTIG